MSRQPLKYLKNGVIEDVTARRIREYEAKAGVTVRLPVPIEKIVEQVLGLDFEWDEIEEQPGEQILGGLVAAERKIVLNEKHLTLFKEKPGLERSTIGHEAGHWDVDIDRARLFHPTFPGFEVQPQVVKRHSRKADRLIEVRFSRAMHDDRAYRLYKKITAGQAATERTFSCLGSLPAGATLVFHHSVRISKDDYSAILSGVRKVASDVSVSFVWVNTHNNFRLFDSRSESDGSIQRGSFVPISRRRVLVSTTGHNAYRKAMGTPRPLEVSADHFRPGAKSPIGCDARTLAIQVLNLTKLNWASTDSFSADPITIKYAGDIAYLTAAFLRQREPFQLHRVLERTPWFV